MKKALIAGVASVAMAAMPVAGAFATVSGEFTDTLQVTIDDACTLTRSSASAHTNGDSSRGAWGTETTADTLSGTLAAGELDSDFGSSTFNVVCNHNGGWKVTAAATALAGKTDTSINIPLGTPAADTAAWNYTSSSSDEEITGTGTFSATSQIVAQSTKTTETAGRNFSVKYAVSVDHALKAQAYEGTITYTLAEL